MIVMKEGFALIQEFALVIKIFMGLIVLINDVPGTVELMAGVIFLLESVNVMALIHRKIVCLILVQEHLFVITTGFAIIILELVNVTLGMLGSIAL